MPVAPPPPRDLPLNALRAFEAAARLGSFAAAAAELGVTAGAVTAHVKALEDRLGARLFDRDARGVRMTAAGARAAPSLTAAFDALAAATRDLREAGAPARVHIAALPAVAQLWLSPRLAALGRANPGLEVSVTALEAPPNLKRAPYDLALFYGGPEDGTLVAPVDLTPVCAPSLAAGLRTPADLAGVPCLSDAVWSGDWAAWCAGIVPPFVPPFVPRGPVFSLYALAVDAAVAGAGVLMGHSALVAPQLASGALVAPFAHRVRLDRSLRLRPARAAPPGGMVARVMRGLTAGG
ncbi:MAG: LysR family transcriptional regulator [Rhodobacteraceae bacterium]|jgi:LysR family glycine cleavage system transcriptional activator|nr:LysR family transcriptional regulator [Paracoccaceae bacterium]